MRKEGGENGRVDAPSFGPATEVSHRRASVAHGSIGARTPTSMSTASFSKGRPGEVSVEQLRQPYVLTSTDALFQFRRDQREGHWVVTPAPEALGQPRSCRDARGGISFPCCASGTVWRAISPREMSSAVRPSPSESGGGESEWCVGGPRGTASERG